MGKKPKKKLKIAIVDDHLLFAEGLKALVEEKEKLGHCVIYQNGEEALQGIPFEKPDLVLVDLHLPGLSGLEVVKILRENMPLLRILILTMDVSGHSLLEALSLGASGYILKSAPFTRIINDIQTALQGDIVIGTEMAQHLTQGFQLLHSEPNTLRAFHELTRREKEVLQLIVQGKDNRTIAQELFLSEKTVKNYVTNILNKLNLEDRVKLVVFSLREGLSPNEENRQSK
ncbi:MAG: response regulator transcription factor [Atribacterota bacterium]